MPKKMPTPTTTAASVTVGVGVAASTGGPRQETTDGGRRVGKRGADASRSAAHARRLAAAALGAAVVAVHVAMAVVSMSPMPHIGGDNAGYLALANSLAQHGAYVETWHPDSPPHAKYPPAYPAVLAIMILAGAKTWGAFKALSVFCTGLATGFCFLWLRRRTGVWRAAALSLLFGVAPALLYASQWILSEPMFLALILGSLWLLTPDAGSEHRLEAAARYLAAGLVLAIATYFTRSAGLPLAAAAALCLAQDKRWRVLAGFAALFALPAVLWHVRPGVAYAADFWLVNPYVADLGKAGPVDLIWRVGDNLWRYAVEYVPGSLTGVYGALRMVAGLILASLALGGWVASMRRRPGVAEYFFALYAGLILLWPVQWSGDRFALPLLPLVLLYATDALAFLVRKLTSWARSVQETLGPGFLPARGVLPARRILAAAAVALVATPAVLSWVEVARDTRDCRTATERAGAFACAPVPALGFHALSVWAGHQLPEGSIVLSRKPRLFHAFSGLPSAVFPFSENDWLLLAQADSLGAEYLLRASWDNSIVGYVDPVVAAHPHRFCRAAALRHTDGLVVSLLAIKPPPPEGAPSGPVLEVCPEWANRQQLPPPSALSSMTVPLLDR